MFAPHTILLALASLTATAAAQNGKVFCSSQHDPGNISQAALAANIAAVKGQTESSSLQSSECRQLSCAQDSSIAVCSISFSEIEVKPGDVAAAVNGGKSQCFGYFGGQADTYGAFSVQESDYTIEVKDQQTC